MVAASDRKEMRLRLTLIALLPVPALLPLTAFADTPWPTPPAQQNPYAYQGYNYAGAPGTGTSPVDCNAATTNAPSGFDCNSYHYSSKVDPTVEPGSSGVRPSSQELGGVIGPSVDRAWDVTTGRPDVHIAVLDSGIMWNSYSDMQQLRNKVALNWAELPPPESADGTSACTGVTLPSRTTKLPSPGFPLCYDLDHDGVVNI